jgi:hypothetical protein
MEDWDWILTDFSTVIPEKQVSRKALPGVWQLSDYTTPEFSGKAVFANPLTGAPEIRITLPLKGRYDIFVGLWHNYCDRIKLKLGSDPCFERLTHSPALRGVVIEEVWWRTADLDGKETLHIKQSDNMRACIAFIIARKADNHTEPRKEYLLHITDDGLPSNWGIPEDMEDTCWNVRPATRLRADYISRGTNPTTMADYNTRHESLRRNYEEMLKYVYPDEIYRQIYVNLARYEKEGFCVPERYFALARECGMKPFVYLRMSMYHASPPWTCFFSRFYDEHPEFHCIDIDGIPVNRASFAFPQTRAEMLKLFTEGIEMGAEGVTDCFVRGFPFVLYEEPVKQRFKELFGADITKFPEDAPEVCRVRAEFMNTFMREQRKAIDEASKGRKPEVMAVVHSDRKACLFYGLDVEAWVKEGLVDILCPYTWGIEARPTEIDTGYFADVVKGSNVKLLPFLGSLYDDKNPVNILGRALQMCEYPIDGFSFWDGVDNRTNPLFQRVISSLISKDEIRRAMNDLKTWPKHYPVLTQDGTKVNKHHFGLSM